LSESKILNGLAAIGDYLETSRAGIRRAIKDEGLPAKRTRTGTWRSHKDAIDLWCLKQVVDDDEDLKTLLR